MIGDFRLTVFVALAECGSFTAAAAKLGVSQPAVSQNITELEKSTGCQLVERFRGEIHLTESGKLLLEYAKRILYWYGRIESELVEKTALPPVPGSVGLSDGRTAEIFADGDLLSIKISK